MFGFIRKENSDRILQKTVYTIFTIALGFAAISSTILLEHHYRNIELSENVLYLFVAVHFFREYIQFIKNPNKGTILDLEYVKTDPYLLKKEFGLTLTQNQIAIGLIEGLQHQEIATFLDKNPETIHRHACDIYKRTNSAPLPEFLRRFRPKKFRVHPKPSKRKKNTEN
jgi:hypothetical protein